MFSEIEMDWFIIQTQSMRENKAKQAIYENLKKANVEEQVQSLLILTQDTLENNQGKTKKVTKKLFPTYLLIQMKPYKDVVRIILNSACVVGFLGASRSNPTPLKKYEIEHMLKMNEDDTSKDYSTNFQVGQIVRIIDGPFTDFKGSIKQMNLKKNSCVLDVYILGRSTPVELSFFQIEKES